MEVLVAEAISGYNSIRIPAQHSAIIAPFVRELLAVLDFDNPTAARRSAVVLTRHVHWCWVSGAYPLDKDVVLRRDVIAESIGKGMSDYSKRTRGTYQSVLFKMSDALLDPALRAPKIPTVGASKAQSPYSELEVIQLRSWARGQSTQHTRVNAHMLLALGLGAGLVAREMADLRCADVLVDDDGVQLNVSGRRPRLVPVTAEWEGLIANVADTAMRKQQWLFLHGRGETYSKNFMNNFVGRTGDRPFPISAQKLRATWIVRHLTHGVPVVALWRASGVASPEALWRYAEHVPGCDPIEERRALRALATDLGVKWKN